MIISEEQAQLALRVLHTIECEGGLAVPNTGFDAHIPPRLMERVNEVLAGLPETRVDRIEQARAELAHGMYSADDVADKIIARIISDSLR